MAVYRQGKIWWSKFTYRGQKYNVCTEQNARCRAIAWQCKFRAGLFDKVDGNFKRRRLIRRLPSDTTLGELIDRYVVEVLLSRPRESDGSLKDWIEGHMYLVDDLVAYFGYRAKPLNVSTPHAIARYNHYLLQRLAPNVVDNRLSLLRAVLFKGYDWGVLKNRPYVKLNRLDNRVNRYISDQEEQRLLKHCDPILAGFVCFLLDTGARKSEAVNLLWRDVDLERKPRPSVTLVHTKTNDPRVIPLPKRSAKALRKMAAIRRVEDAPVFSQQATRRIVNQFRVVYAHKGQWVPMTNLEPKWAKAKAAADLRDVRIHDLRHTYASRLLRKGAPLHDVGRLLGHRTWKMTLRYAHLSSEGLDNAVKLLD